MAFAFYSPQSSKSVTTLPIHPEHVRTHIGTIPGEAQRAQTLSFTKAVQLDGDRIARERNGRLGEQLFARHSARYQCIIAAGAIMARMHKFPSDAALEPALPTANATGSLALHNALKAVNVLTPRMRGTDDIRNVVDQALRELVFVGIANQEYQESRSFTKRSFGTIMGGVAYTTNLTAGPIAPFTPLQLDLTHVHGNYASTDGRGRGDSGVHFALTPIGAKGDIGYNAPIQHLWVLGLPSAATDEFTAGEKRAYVAFRSLCPTLLCVPYVDTTTLNEQTRTWTTVAHTGVLSAFQYPFTPLTFTRPGDMSEDEATGLITACTLPFSNEGTDEANLFAIKAVEHLKSRFAVALNSNVITSSEVVAFYTHLNTMSAFTHNHKAQFTTLIANVATLTVTRTEINIQVVAREAAWLAATNIIKHVLVVPNNGTDPSDADNVRTRVYAALGFNADGNEVDINNTAFSQALLNFPNRRQYIDALKAAVDQGIEDIDITHTTYAGVLAMIAAVTAAADGDPVVTDVVTAINVGVVTDKDTVLAWANDLLVLASSDAISAYIETCLQGVDARVLAVIGAHIVQADAAYTTYIGALKAQTFTAQILPVTPVFTSLKYAKPGAAVSTRLWEQPWVEDRVLFRAALILRLAHMGLTRAVAKDVENGVLLADNLDIPATFVYHLNTWLSLSSGCNVARPQYDASLASYMSAQLRLTDAHASIKKFWQETLPTVIKAGARPVVGLSLQSALPAQNYNAVIGGRA